MSIASLGANASTRMNATVRILIHLSESRRPGGMVTVISSAANAPNPPAKT